MMLELATERVHACVTYEHLKFRRLTVLGGANVNRRRQETMQQKLRGRQNVPSYATGCCDTASKYRSKSFDYPRTVGPELENRPRVFYCSPF
jgi:hypothetical protein